MANKKGRISKHQLVVEATVHDHKHLSSADLVQRRGALQETLNDTTSEIDHLQSVVDKMKTRRGKLEAEIEGLGAVLSAR